jgi:hypothetical protein
LMTRISVEQMEYSLIVGCQQHWMLIAEPINWTAPEFDHSIGYVED